MKYIIFISLILIIFSCGNNEENITVQPIKKNNSGIKDTMQNVNKYIIEVDEERIDAYIKRMGWNMQRTKTGLYYEIYRYTKGKKAQKDLIAKLKYKVELLDGTVCYSSENSALKTFKIGHSDSESGLTEGVLLMHEGEKARFIMLPHLAYGLTGDYDKIPTMSIIVYDVELIKLIDF